MTSHYTASLQSESIFRSWAYRDPSRNPPYSRIIMKNPCRAPIRLPPGLNLPTSKQDEDDLEPSLYGRAALPPPPQKLSSSKQGYISTSSSDVEPDRRSRSSVKSRSEWAQGPDHRVSGCRASIETEDGIELADMKSGIVLKTSHKPLGLTPPPSEPDKRDEDMYSPSSPFTPYSSSPPSPARVCKDPLRFGQREDVSPRCPPSSDSRLTGSSFSFHRDSSPSLPPLHRTMTAPSSIPDILITNWDITHGRTTRLLEPLDQNHPVPAQDASVMRVPRSDPYTMPHAWQQHNVVKRVSCLGVVLTRRRQSLNGCMRKQFTCFWKRRDARGRCSCQGRALDLEDTLPAIAETGEMDGGAEVEGDDEDGDDDESSRSSSEHEA